MGRGTPLQIEHATEQNMEEITWNYDGDEAYTLGHWSQFEVNAHVRVVIEKLPFKHYCIRSLVRSAMIFEAVEELNVDPWWKGRIYYRNIELGVLNCVARTEDLGEFGFRKRYKELGGKAKW